MQKSIKLWRESASLLILAKNFTPTVKWNYKILTVKRSKTMKFMPNLYTFPGGVIEKSDSVLEWLQLYEHFGFSKSHLKRLEKEKNALIFKNFGDDEIPRYMSLRINAIRETFEECGILICKSADVKTNNENRLWTSCLGGPNLKEWQKKVQKDSTKFLEMCSDLEIYPDIFALHDWSNWLTPFTMPQQFDTVFFQVALPSIPPVIIDENEIEDIEWANPFDYLKYNHTKKLTFAPPQYYETSKLIPYHDIDELLKIAHLKSKEGMKQILPYRILFEGKHISIFPGDDMYPDRTKLEETTIPEVAILPDCQKIHRMVHTKQVRNEIFFQNLEVPHLPPYEYRHEN